MGLSWKEIGTAYGVSAQTVQYLARSLATPSGGRSVKALENRRRYHEAIRLRLSEGAAPNRIAKELGLSSNTVGRCLDDMGIARPGMSASAKRRSLAATPEEMERIRAAKSAAQRGIPRGPLLYINTAKTFQARLGRAGRLEEDGWREFARRGIALRRQVAVGSYNIDLAEWPIAVEVDCGAGLPHVRKPLAKRTATLRAAGWVLVYLMIGKNGICRDAYDLAEEAIRRAAPGSLTAIRGFDGRLLLAD